MLSSGRLCGVLLEYEIAARFEGVEASASQGAGADLICDHLGAIQVKTYRSTGDAVFRSGPRQGTRKAAVPSVWTTKSGLWDRTQRTQSQLAEAHAYLDDYDHFCYIEISAMSRLQYSFVIVPTTQVRDSFDGLRISEDSLGAHIARAVHLDPTPEALPQPAHEQNLAAPPEDPARPERPAASR